MCWYDPPEEEKRAIKSLCVELVHRVKALEKMGDPIGFGRSDVEQLIDHLFDSSKCEKK